MIRARSCFCKERQATAAPAIPFIPAENLEVTMTAPRSENLEHLSVRPGTSPVSESQATPDRQLKDFSETLSSLSSQWPSARWVALHWDEHRHVLATDGALATYRAIYGNDLVRGLHHIWASANRRWRGEPHSSREPFRLNAPLPPDAIVFPQRSYPSGTPYVVTVVSSLEQRVVKIFSNERKSRFESELNAWRLAQVAGIGHRVPEVVASGESANGFCWLATRLVRNSAVNPPIIGDWLWRRYLLARILPDLQRFYQQSGIDMSAGGVWLEKVRAELSGHPLSAPLQKLADCVDAALSRARENRIPVALVHGDLRPHNVHRHAGQWWLIDWSMSRRAPIMIDLWPNPSKSLKNEIFGAWLRGHMGLEVVPRRLRTPLNQYAEWQLSWLGIKLDADSLRFHALATLLHRLSHKHWPQRTLANLTFSTIGIRNNENGLETTRRNGH
jgi:hypothetical protein